MKYNDRVRTLQLQNGTKSKKHIRLNRGVVKAKMPQDNVNREQVVVGTSYKGTTLKMPQYETDKDSLIGSTSDYGDNGKVDDGDDHQNVNDEFFVMNDIYF